MKKITMLLIVGVCVLSFVQLFAAPAATQTINVQAQIGTGGAALSPEMDIVLLQFDKALPSSANPYDPSLAKQVFKAPPFNMDLGTLKHTLDDGSDAGVWFGQFSYMVHIFTQSFGSRYTIRVAEFSGLLGQKSGKTIPVTAFGGGMANVAQDQNCFGVPVTCVDQGADPNPGAQKGPDGPHSAGRIIYDSGTGTKSRIIQFWAGIPPFAAGGRAPFPGYTPLKLDEFPADTYTGTLTLEIVAK